MRIEIKIGGLNGSLKKLESGFSDHIKDREKVISTFKDVRKRTYDVHGGYSDLHTAISYVDGRIAKEEHKIARAREAKKKTASLLELSRRVDAQVADQVDRNRHAFYDRFPHLKPESIKQEERKWYEKVWDWVCDTGKNIVNCVKKAWNGIKEYYTKHKKIFDTIFIALGAIIAIVGTVLTGGAALVALLGCLGIASSVAAVIATTVVVVSVVATAGSAILNIVDTWCEIDHPVFNTFQKVFDITAIVADVTLGGAELIDAIKKGVSKFFLKHGDDVLDTVGDVAARNLDDIGEAATRNLDEIGEAATKNLDEIGENTMKNADKLDGMSNNTPKNNNKKWDSTVYEGDINVKGPNGGTESVHVKRKVYQYNEGIDLDYVRSDGLTNREAMRLDLSPEVVVYTDKGAEISKLDLHHLTQEELIKNPNSIFTHGTLVEMPSIKHKEYSKVIHMTYKKQKGVRLSFRVDKLPDHKYVKSVGANHFDAFKKGYWKNRLIQLEKVLGK